MGRVRLEGSGRDPHEGAGSMRARTQSEDRIREDMSDALSGNAGIRKRLTGTLVSNGRNQASLKVKGVGS